MPSIPPELLTLLGSGGFSILFVWLLLRTQQRQDLREDKMMGLLQIHTETLPQILEALRALPEISKATADLVRVVGSMERRMEEIEKNQRGK